MAPVPSQSPDPRDVPDQPPQNVEAEQALLGAMLYDSEATAPHLSGALQPAHFFEPFHGRLWRAIQTMVNRGQRANPVVLAEQFRRDAVFKELGGLRYLADMLDRAPPSSHAAQVEPVLVDLAMRRAMIEIGRDLALWAKDGHADEDGDPLTAMGIAAEAERRLTEAQLGTAVLETSTLDSVIDGVMAYVDDRDAVTGVLSGLRPLDLQIGPMIGGDLILDAGRPGMGKSALALAVALNVGAPALADFINGRDYDNRAPGGVIEVHGEMGWEDGRDGVAQGGQVARRHLADVGYALYGAKFPTYKDLRDKKVTVDQRAMMTEAASHLRGHPIVGLKRAGLTVADLRSLCRRQATAWKRAGITLRLIVIDHVGLMRADKGTRGSRYEAQTEIAIGLKILAGELGCPILALVQLSRDVERRDDKRPNMGDLRDSGAWEENADIILMPYRESYYAKKEKEPGQGTVEWAEWDQRCRSLDLDVGLAKIREGEGSGIAKLWAAMGHNAIRGHAPDRDLVSLL